MSNQTLFTVITFNLLIGVYAGVLVNRFSSRVANPD